MPHTFTNILMHVIFSTKARQGLLNDELKARLFPYMGGIVRELGGTALPIDGPSDHVHLLVAMPATTSLSDLIRVLKANSSRWANEEKLAQDGFGWQTGYSAFTVSRSMHENVKKYIETQVEHHKTVSFQEEYLAFLKKHGLQYDERYVWD
jgi:REP element-mobilizing transposase RayT